MKITCYLTGAIQANTYLAFDEETKKGFVVDPGGDCPELLNEAKRESVDITHIILTHGHGDHIGGIDFILSAFPEAEIVAHKDEEEMLLDPALNLSRDVCPKKVSVKADILVDDKDTLNIGNMELTFIHTPGHSLGGMCIYSEGHLFCGDTIFHNSIGRSDFYGGDYRTLINSIKDRIYVFPDDTILLPGHMGKSTVGDEKRGNPFV